MKNKVLILSSVHRWDDTRIFHKQAKSLAKIYDIELHAIADFKYKVFGGINIYGHKRSLKIFPFRIWLQYLIIALRSGSKTVHLHDPDLIFLGVLLRILGKIVIYDVHEDMPGYIMDKTWIPKIFRQLISIFFDITERATSIFFSEIIVVTEKVGERFLRKNPVYICNYPSISNFPRNPNHKNKSNLFSIIYVGVITPRRGIVEVIQAVSHLNNKFKCQVNIIGPIPDANFEEYLKKLVLKSRIPFLFKGALSYNKAMIELYSADVGIVCIPPKPYFLESLPNKMFEYMIAGLPVICSNFPLWKDLIEKNNCGITVDPLNPTEITNAIQYLYSNPEYLKIMGMNGRKLVEEQFNWENEEEKLLKLYNKLFE